MKKLPLRAAFLFIFFVIANLAQNTPIPVKVGVVLDMNYVGQMGLNCIEMALSDFYDTHSHYKTRLVLHTRDSQNDVVIAASAALDLLKNDQVQAIIGPLSSTEANFIISLGNKAQVPIITFSATSPLLSSSRSPYFIRAALNDSSQVKAISSIVQTFGWREVVPIYVDNEFGEGIIPFLTDALEQVNARVPYRSVISPSATDEQIVEELYKLMTMQTRVFVVHMLTNLGGQLFTKANELGMMSRDYVWIITDGMTNELSVLDSSVMQSMLGVIGVRSYVPDSKELADFTTRYKRRIQQNSSLAVSSILNIFGLWAYDSATALAMAVENAALTNTSFLTSNVSRKSTDLDKVGVSSAGPQLVQALSSTMFEGLAGNFSLVDGQLQSPPYQIVNLVGPGARVVGYWTQQNGIVRDLSLTNNNTDTISTSRSNLGSVIWPGDTTVQPKGWVIPTDGKKLRIGVPVKDGFTEFLRVTWNDDNYTQVEGYCIDVFDAVMEKLPYGVQYEYIPFANSHHGSAGSYNDLVYQVYLGNFDAVVGDVTIVANRSNYVDFTLPYTESGVYMVVPIKDNKGDNAWAFLKPLTWQLWLTSFCSFVFIGFLVWILEHRINEEFRGPFWHQVGMVFWFSFSTMVFAHKERVTSNPARFVLIIWFLLVLILTQSYTASLTSILTVQQLQPAVTNVNDLLKSNKYVGYQQGSFVLGLLKNMNFPESRLVVYNSPEELNELLSNGTIAAAFDEIPYMKLFLANHCSKYMSVDPTYKTDGFAFVFPRGSPLVPDVSRAILNVTEGQRMSNIQREWLGDKTACPDSSSILSSSSLGLESFWGLFLIVGIASILAFIFYIIQFLHQNWDVVEWSNTRELFHRFINRDQSSHTFRDVAPKEGPSINTCDCMRMTPSNDYIQSAPSTFALNSPCNNGPPSPVFSSPHEQYANFQESVAQRDSIEETELVNLNQSERFVTATGGTENVVQ